MRDLHEAIEQLSALLFYRIERVAGKRGWAVKSSARQVAAAAGRPISLVTTTVHLPRGMAGTFMPREQPMEGAGAWPIDIRRSDGIHRRSWAGGFRVQGGASDPVLCCDEKPLSDEVLNEILDDMARPGPSGVELWIRRLWAMRFGALPLELSSRLESIKDVDQLDALQAAMLRVTNRAEAEASLRGQQ